MDKGDQSNDIIDIVLHRGEEGLGFNIRGGLDMPHIPQDVGIFVTKVRDVGAAASDGNLQEGDKILKLNGRDLLEVTHQTAVSLFKSAGKEVRLTVLKDAERKAVVAAIKNRQLLDNAQKSKDANAQQLAVKLGAFGVVILIGYLTFRSRHNIKDFISRLFIGSDRITYPYPKFHPKYHP